MGQITQVKPRAIALKMLLNTDKIIFPFMVTFSRQNENCTRSKTLCNVNVNDG